MTQSFINPYRREYSTLESLSAVSSLCTMAVVIVKDYMDPDPVHDDQHLIRVAQNVLWLSDSKDRELLICGALLHDLVNVPKDSDKRAQASKMSADLAINLIKDHPSIKLRSINFLDNLHHMIVSHSHSANIAPMTEEAKALQDADRLESLGPVGIIRMFECSTALHRTAYHPTDPVALYRDIDETQYGLDHISRKLAKLAKTMQTSLGKKYAKHLTHQLMEFVYQLVEQVGMTFELDHDQRWSHETAVMNFFSDHPIKLKRG